MENRGKSLIMSKDRFKEFKVLLVDCFFHLKPFTLERFSPT